jgi:hypothetical protein
MRSCPPAMNDLSMNLSLIPPPHHLFYPYSAFIVALPRLPRQRMDVHTCPPAMNDLSMKQSSTRPRLPARAASPRCPARPEAAEIAPHTRLADANADGEGAPRGQRRRAGTGRRPVGINAQLSSSHERPQYETILNSPTSSRSCSISSLPCSSLSPPLIIYFTHTPHSL